MSRSTIVAVFAVAVLASGGALTLWLDSNGFNGNGGGKEKAENNEVSDDRLPELDKEKHRQLDEGDSGGSDDVSDSEQSENSTHEETEDEGYEASIVLNNFGQRDSGKVYANATVDGKEEGTCEFRFSRSNSSVVKTAQIRQAPTGYYACGISVESSKFSPKGKWTARAYVQNTNPQVRSESDSTRIE